MHRSFECTAGNICIYISLWIQVLVAGENYTIGQVKFFSSHVDTPVKFARPSAGRQAPVTLTLRAYLSRILKFDMKLKFHVLLRVT